MDITELSVVPFWGWTEYTPVIPKMYWDVYSQEERIKLLLKDHDKLVHYASYLAQQITENNKNMEILDDKFNDFIEGRYDEYYEQKIAEWVDENMVAIMERATKNVYFGLTDDGYFMATVPQDWNELMFDTGYVYDRDDYGRLILVWDVDTDGKLVNQVRGDVPKGLEWYPTQQLKYIMENADAIEEINEDGWVTSARIKDGAVIEAKLADGSVTTVKMADLNVTTGKLADGAVTNAKIADAAVTSAKIADGTIATADLANGSVTTAKIADSNVTEGKLANNAVTTSKIKDAAVTSAKIADGTIATADLANGSVTTAKIADSTVTGTKLANDSVAPKHIVVGDSSVSPSDTSRITYYDDSDESKFLTMTGAQLKAYAATSPIVYESATLVKSNYTLGSGTDVMQSMPFYYDFANNTLQSMFTVIINNPDSADHSYYGFEGLYDTSESLTENTYLLALHETHALGSSAVGSFEVVSLKTTASNGSFVVAFNSGNSYTIGKNTVHTFIFIGTKKY